MKACYIARMLFTVKFLKERLKAKGKRLKGKIKTFVLEPFTFHLFV